MRVIRIGSALLAGCALAAAAWAGQGTAPAKPRGTDPALLHPEQMTAKAPDVYQVKFTTTKGDFVVEVTRGWAPQGADRFYNLIKHHYYDQAAFFRVLNQPRPFVVQFGISADPKLNAVWQTANIKDDPVTQHNVRGTVTFATGGPNTRTTQVFINLTDNSRLDGMGFSPFGTVVEGMDIVDKFYGGYGEGAPNGPGPAQDRIQSEGKAYLDKNFPKLDSIITAVIIAPAGAAPAPAKAPAKPPAKPTGK
jgi:peptidyl-prolyl cis-trans isomerase A (cyclophilin A)